MAADFMAFQDVLWNFLRAVYSSVGLSLNSKENKKTPSYHIPEFKKLWWF